MSAFKSLLILMGLGCLGAAFAGEVPLRPHDGLWKPLPSGEYAIEVPADRWSGGLAGELAVREGCFYLLTWEQKIGGANDERPVNLKLQSGDETLHVSRSGAPEWIRAQAYFFAKAGGALKFDFYFPPGAAVKAELRNFSVRELASAELKKNLFGDGDFESGNTIPAEWRKDWGQKSFAASLVPSPDFLCGEKSLRLKLSPEARASIVSNELPIAPGRKYKISFWARGSKELPLRGLINCMSPIRHEGAHLFHSRTFPLTTEWKQFDAVFDVPADLAAYPDLKDGYAKLQFSVPQGDGEIWLDGIEYCEQ